MTLVGSINFQNGSLALFGFLLDVDMRHATTFRYHV